ncbi:centromere kinetochore component CENP-T-domain-containing protein [Stachybotrys elegans]|uniref:Centromere kinetochore component CENP-T-domain-containing protein n=1 Tax=Stachybotrys elegans TaxID=80388 RepID=A0A8K0WL10_9HYPO|nr:centromere kinetochore component CENP-T-domain-containing protein [Stachybotrys elegans]
MDETPTNLSNGRTPGRTPMRRAISAEPPSSRRSIHTPLDRTAPRDLLNSVRRGTSASGGRRNNAPTPHATAARRALHQRRTALFTPGKNRRKSQLQQRETPHGLLSNLAKALAPHSKRIVSSSSPREGTSSSIAPIMEEEDDDELPIDRPRLSLPIDDDDDDDDDDLQPPLSSGLENDNLTVQSIELPRRFISEPPDSRLSRGSFGSVGVSDYFEQNEHSEEIGQHSDFFPGLFDNLQAQIAANEGGYERMDDITQRTNLGRESDFGLQMPVEVDEQTTFLLSEPAPELTHTSLVAESPVAEAHAENAQDTEPLIAFADDDDDDDNHGGFEEMDGQMEDVEDNDAEEDATAVDRGARASQARKKQKKVSRLGIEYPALPPSFVKRVAQTALQSSSLNNPRISADTLEALTQASEWFFEQLGDDLGAYAGHAKRKTIEESDVVTLMRR